MRRILMLATLAALLLASCNSAPEPTATPVPPTEPPAETTQMVLPTDPFDDLGEFEGTLTVPIAGTMSIANTVLTPNATPLSAANFDVVYFSQMGGAANIDLNIELHGDGTLVRDGETSTVSQEDVQKIADMIDAAHFFQINGTFISGSASADAYHYALTVNLPDGSSRSIGSQDGLTPPELQEIYEAILALSGT